MENKEKKKKHHLKFKFKVLIFIILVIIYMFTFGTIGIFIKEYQVKTDKITDSYHGLKIAHFSDLHYGSTKTSKKLNELVKQINKTKPDIIIFSGDLINAEYELSDDETKKIINYFNMLDASLGKYFVKGEEDDENTNTILTEAGFINIDNNEQLIYNESSVPIIITGANAFFEYLNSNDTSNLFKILVTHKASDFNKVKGYEFDIVLAGHTHNAQINLFKLNELIIKDKYNKKVQKDKNTTIFVNSGIGTSVINVRLFNHPMINLYRLNKTKNN